MQETMEEMEQLGEGGTTMKASERDPSHKLRGTVRKAGR